MIPIYNTRPLLCYELPWPLGFVHLEGKATRNCAVLCGIIDFGEAVMTLVQPDLEP